MKVIDKDITTVNSGLIGHQVNLRGVMGAGLARQIKQKWPVVYERYSDWVTDASLGDVLLVSVEKRLSIVNIAGQKDYGKGKRYTDYDGLTDGLRKIHRYTNHHNRQLYLPYKIGCGLAGGEWKIVRKIIGQYCPDTILCRI